MTWAHRGTYTPATHHPPAAGLSPKEPGAPRARWGHMDGSCSPLATPLVLHSHLSALPEREKQFVSAARHECPHASPNGDPRSKVSSETPRAVPIPSNLKLKASRTRLETSSGAVKKQLAASAGMKQLAGPVRKENTREEGSRSAGCCGPLPAASLTPLPG